MISSTILESISKQISALLTENSGQDLKNNVQQILARQLNKLDLVSRDEFDAQQAVLLRTREKLDALEKQLNQLQQEANG